MRFGWSFYIYEVPRNQICFSIANWFIILCSRLQTAFLIIEYQLFTFPWQMAMIENLFEFKPYKLWVITPLWKIDSHFYNKSLWESSGSTTTLGLECVNTIPNWLEDNWDWFSEKSYTTQAIYCFMVSTSELFCYEFKQESFNDLTENSSNYWPFQRTLNLRNNADSTKIYSEIDINSPQKKRKLYQSWATTDELNI